MAKFMREPVERLKKKVQKENLWFFILCILERQDKYGYELRNLLKERFGFLTGNVTAYKVLYLLEKGGYVKQAMKGNKKYYRATSSGIAQLKKARKFFKEMKKL